jgi:hypothetical protein
VDNSVEVRYAGVVVGRGAIVKDFGVGSAGINGLDAGSAGINGLGAGSAFVGVPEPLPVGTLVTLKIGDAVYEARVDDVVESSEPTAVGMRVSWGGAPRAPAPRVVAPALAPPPVVAAAPAPPPVVAAAPAPPRVVAPAQAPPLAEPVQAVPAAAPAPPVAAPEDASSAIPAPISLAGPGADGSRQGGGKKRRKRR